MISTVLHLLLVSVTLTTYATAADLVPIKAPEQAATPADQKLVQRLIKQGAQDRKDAILYLKQFLGPNGKSHDGFSPLSGTDVVEDAKESLSVLLKNRTSLPMMFNIEQGNIGVLLDSRRSLRPRAPKVVQVVDDSNMLVDISSGTSMPNECLVWLSGFRTAGLVDDQCVTCNCIVEVSGTKMYGTAGNATKTVPVLKPFRFELTQPKKK